MSDLIQRLLGGFQAGQQIKAGRLANALGGQLSQPGFDLGASSEFAQLQALDPARAAQIQGSFSALSDDRKKAFFLDMRKGKELLEAGEDRAFMKLMDDRLNDVQRLGGDPEDVMLIRNSFLGNNKDRALFLMGLAEREGVEQGFLSSPKSTATADMKSFENLTDIANLSPALKEKAAKIKLGLQPRAMGSAAQTISQDEQLTQDVAASQAAITSAKEGAKLRQQFKLKPEIEEAVALARGRANLIGEKNKEARSDQKALQVYEIAFSSLAQALGDTATGPGIGLMPAITANAQMAEGAVAMILPTLKNVFREAGEGTFTEGDQKLLTDMIPTRNDSPEARKFKLEAIDSIIRTKLGAAPAAPQVKQSTEFEGFRVIR